MVASFSSFFLSFFLFFSFLLFFFFFVLFCFPFFFGSTSYFALRYDQRSYAGLSVQWINLDIINELYITNSSAV